MTPDEFLNEAASNGFVFAITISKGIERVEYHTSFILVQNPPINKTLHSMQDVADFIEEQIIGWFPESDYAKRLLRAHPVKAKTTGMH